MMMQSDIAPLLQKAIEQKINDIIEEEIVEARNRVSKRVREQVGSIAATVLSRFSYEKMGETLVIKVDFSHGN